ncbi:MAG: transpeptidase family protein [Bacteroidaceae bacterium]|nr:transpeptidase family protein [Bacteroidaceae bacterium]
MKFEKKYIASQTTLVLIIALVFCVGILFYMVKTMVFDKNFWEDQRRNNFEQDSLSVPAMRGNILSADGQLMASSLPDYKVYIDFKSGLTKEAIKTGRFTKQDSLFHFTKDSLFMGKGEKYAAMLDTICNGLAAICPKRTAAEYRRHLAEGWNAQSRYFEVCKGTTLNYIQYTELIKLPFFRDFQRRKYYVGLTVEERNNRKKPFGSLAKRTLGEMYGAKDSARSGMELAYDSLLRGVPGIKHRRKILSKYIDLIDIKPQNGFDIVSTIDVTMQDVCESALREEFDVIKGTNGLADMGVVVLMETKTGDVKAIVNLSLYDDGNYYEARNFALAALMEPGSTFKTASILVGLDDGELTLNDHTNGNGGVYNMYGSMMKDHNWNRGGYGDMDVAHTLMYSSNIGVSRLIDARYHNKPEKFVEGLHRIGIGADLELPFVGSAKPVIRMPKPDGSNWSKTALAWMSIGYETQIPPISTVSFYNAIANNGTMVAPRFVKAVQRDGKTVEKMPVKVLKEQIARPEAIKQIQEILVRVVKEGVGKRAGSKYFTVAGKTGTAQVGGKGGYKGGGHLVSFCGYFPAENPQYTCIVAIRLKYGLASGGGQAGPVFKKIAESVYANAVTSDLTRATDSLATMVPEVKSGDIKAAQLVLGNLGISTTIPKYDNGDIATTSTDGTDIDFTIISNEYDHVPNLIGMGLRDAIYEIERRGMKAKATGRGHVKHQSIPSGSKVVPGQVVELELATD